MRFGLLMASCVFGLVTAGCSTTSPEQRIAENRADCAAYGLAEGTTEFSQCVMTLEQQDAASAERRRMAAGAMLAQTGQNMRNNSVTCNTFANSAGSYGMATTRCY